MFLTIITATLTFQHSVRNLQQDHKMWPDSIGKQSCIVKDRYYSKSGTRFARKSFAKLAYCLQISQEVVAKGRNAGLKVVYNQRSLTKDLTPAKSRKPKRLGDKVHHKYFIRLMLVPLTVRIYARTLEMKSWETSYQPTKGFQIRIIHLEVVKQRTKMTFQHMPTLE